MKNRRFSSILAVLLVFVVGISFSFGNVQTVSAASKPAKVKSIAAVSVSQHSIKVSWGKAKRAKGYQLFRNGYAIKAGNIRSFTDSGLAAGTKYTYKVRAYKTSKKKMWYNKKTGKWQKKKPKRKWRGKSKKVTVYHYGAFSYTAAAATRSAPTPTPTPTPTPGGDSGGGSSATPSGSTTPDPGPTTVTDYLGVTRTITNTMNEGGITYYEAEDSTGLSGIYDNRAKIDRTVSGEFTISGGEVMVQTGGSDSATFFKRELNGNPKQRVELQTTTQSMTWNADREFGIRMYGGDPSKLTYEVNHSLETVNTYAQTGWYEYTPTTEKYIKASSGGTYLQRVLQMEVGKLKYPNKTAVYGFSCFLMKPDRTTMCGFKNESITVTIKYNGKKVGAITWTPCEIYKNGAWTVSTVNGMTPNRALAWQIAQEAVATNGGPKSYYDDMFAIQTYFFDQYVYGETITGSGGASLSASCEGGAFVLATYSMKQYGISGFNGYGAANPGSTTHTSFNLNSDPNMYFETQGHN